MKGILPCKLQQAAAISIRHFSILAPWRKANLAKSLGFQKMSQKTFLFRKQLNAFAKDAKILVILEYGLMLCPTFCLVLPIGIIRFNLKLGLGFECIFVFIDFMFVSY